MSAAPLEVGRYVLYDVIASGGMASVHFGRISGSAGFMRVVAIKRLHAHLASDRKFASMFLDEARVASRIHHPNVVGVIDVADLDGELFLVMDYVRGETFSALLRACAQAGEIVPLSVVSAILVGTLYGLHAAHEARDEAGQLMHVVHRDVSPQNILVDLGGVVRVADFGIAKAVSRLENTRDGEVKGKLAYMAPEQLRGGDVDRRTDVYAASVVLWEAITGQRLFGNGDPGTIVFGVMQGASVPPSAHRREVGPALDALVMRGLARGPAERFATALEMAEALSEVVKPATPREVAAWVERVGGAPLAERMRRVTELEQQVVASVPDARRSERKRLAEATTAVEEAPEAAASSRSPLDAVSATPAVAVRRDDRARRALPLVLVAAVLGGGVVALRSVRHLTHLHADGATSASASAVPVDTAAVAVSAEPAASAAGVASVAGPVPAVVGVASSSSASASASAARASASRASPRIDRRASPVAPRRAEPPPAGAAAAAAAAKNDCDPPFTIDENGIKRFKRWCPQ